MELFGFFETSKSNKNCSKYSLQKKKSDFKALANFILKSNIFTLIYPEKY